MQYATRIFIYSNLRMKFIGVQAASFLAVIGNLSQQIQHNIKDVALRKINS